VCSALRSCPLICAALWAGAVGWNLHSNSFSYLCSHRRLDTASQHENWILSAQRKIKNSAGMHARRRWAPLGLGAPVSALTGRFQLSKLVWARALPPFAMFAGCCCCGGDGGAGGDRSFLRQLFMTALESQVTAWVVFGWRRVDANRILEAQCVLN
jgi:hypothetical protein